MPKIITVDQLTKHYGRPSGRPALDCIDLQIEQGEIFSLLGPNGAGKTTLISILCGLLPPTSGQALIGGHDVDRNPMAVKRIIGVVPEEVALYPQLSGRRNLRYFGMLYGLGGEALRDAVDQVLAVTDLVDRADDRVSHYSSGMKRRLNIAAGVLHRPQIVLMDEPTVGLDPESRRRILELVRYLWREQGATIIYATHYMEEAQEISDRVGILHQGRLIAVGSPQELIEASRAEDTVRLVVGDGDPAALALALRQLEHVSGAAQSGKTITLSLPRAAEVLPGILRLAEQTGVELRSMTVEQPNLETVFLQLTGRELTESTHQV
jgi:ABC-2 type transport system ATP-binding protein